MDKKALVENTKINIKTFMDNLGLSRIEDYSLYKGLNRTFKKVGILGH
jgi:hypothetical protein